MPERQHIVTSAREVRTPAASAASDEPGASRRRDDAAGTSSSGPRAGADPFEQLYAELGPSLLRLARLVTGSHSAAQDVVQDSFLKVRDRLDDIERPQVYLRQVVVNRARDWLRSAAREQAYRSTLTEPTVLPAELDEVWLALGRIPERRRIALVLRYYEDLKVEDVADVLGCRVGTAKSLIHRGLDSLRKEVGVR